MSYALVFTFAAARCQARLIGLLFLPEGQPSILPRLERFTTALLEPLYGETGLVRGVRVSANSEESLTSAVQQLKHIDVNNVVRVPIPNDVPGARRRAGDVVRKLEASEQSLFITFGNADIAVHGPVNGAVVKQAGDDIKAAMRAAADRAQNSATRVVTADTETLRCVMGDGAMGLRKIQSQSGCSIQARFNDQHATVTVRGPTEAKVNEACKALNDAIKEVARVEVPVKTDEQREKLFAANGLLAPRLSVIKREYRGGCRFVKEADGKKITVMSQTQEEADQAGKELRKLVEEAAMTFETIPVPSDHVSVWMRPANVELLRLKDHLTRAFFQRGGKGAGKGNSGPTLELVGTPEAVANAKKDIPKVVTNAEVTETFAVLGACSGDGKLVDAVIGTLMRDRAARLNQIGKETGTNLTLLGGSGKGNGRSPVSRGQNGMRRDIRLVGSKADVVQAKRVRTV